MAELRISRGIVKPPQAPKEESARVQEIRAVVAQQIGVEGGQSILRHLSAESPAIQKMRATLEPVLSEKPVASDDHTLLCNGAIKV